MSFCVPQVKMQFLTFVYTVLICAIVYLVYRFLKYLKKREIINKFPGYKSNFFIGDVFNLSRQRDVMFGQFYAWSMHFADGFRMWSAFYPSYIFKKAEDFEVILSNQKYIDKTYLYILFRCWLKDGLLTSTGEKWHRRRKLLTSAFHFNILKKFVIIFEEHNQKFMKDLQVECNKEKTNVVPLFSKLTLDIICETAMGSKLENSKEQEEYRAAIHALGATVITRCINPHQFYDWFYFWFLPSGWTTWKHLKILHNFTSKVIQERERNFNEKDLEQLDQEDDDVVYKKRRFAMLDLLISVKKAGEIDDEGIREEVDTFMFEGHDTTAMALSFIVLLLANYKDIQEKVRDELDQIFNGSTRPAKYDDLQNMIYLERVIKESLRLYPSVPIIGRTSLENIPFRNGKYTIPDYSLIIFFIYSLHRDPEVFPDPEKFEPDRFLPENCKDRNPYAYVPFSAGPRNCIGQRFAMLEMKSVVSSILRYYEIEAIDKREDIVINTDLVLRPRDGIHVKFKQRK